MTTNLTPERRREISLWVRRANLYTLPHAKMEAIRRMFSLTCEHLDLLRVGYDGERYYARKR